MDPNNQTPIKLGFDYRIGQAIYLLNNYKFTISYLHDDTGHYPDGGCSCETYTNQHFLEIETLSKLVQLKPKHSITHVET
jgi:hypothetical protein